MHSPYGMELVEDCLSCKLCSRGLFLPFAEISNGSFPTPEVHARISGGRNSVRGRASMPRHLHSL